MNSSFKCQLVQQGFTLLEVMVVVVIISILLTFVTLSVNNNNAMRQVQLEAERITYLLQLAQEQAILQGQTIGVELLPRGYRFYQLRANTWQSLNRDDTFFNRQLPPAMSFSLYSEDRAVLLDDIDPLPQLLLLSSGELVPFRVLLHLDSEADALWQIQAKLTGEIQLTAVESYGY